MAFVLVARMVPTGIPIRLAFLLFATLAFSVVSVVSDAAKPTIRPRYTSSQIEQMIRNPVLVRREINCVLRKGPCDQLGEDIKLAIPEVITRNCARCTREQTANAKKLIEFIQRNHPGVMGQIRRLYA